MALEVPRGSWCNSANLEYDMLTQLDLVVPRLKTDWLLVQRDFGARANVKREL